MEAIKRNGRGKDGKLTVQIPEQFDGQDLEIIILSSSEKINDDDLNNLKEKKIERLMSIIGTAKDLNKSFDKHDVYEQ